MEKKATEKRKILIVFTLLNLDRTVAIICYDQQEYKKNMLNVHTE